MTDFFINIGITIILQLLSTKKIPESYVRGLIKTRDALNLAFPPNLGGDTGKGFKIVTEK